MAFCATRTVPPPLECAFYHFVHECKVKRLIFVMFFKGNLYRLRKQVLFFAYD